MKPGRRIRTEEHLDAYLAAKRMELTEDAYVAFAAQNPENYTESLELEKAYRTVRDGNGNSSRNSGS